MPTFKNDLDHAVYASANGKSHKLGAGKVASFTGDVADAFEGLVEQGYVSKLEGDEAKKALAAQQADTVDPTLTAEGRMPGQIAAAVGRIGLLTVSAPLQVVIGDDTAPFGPGSGTVTTKQALATADPAGVDRKQFAEGEVLVTDPKLAEPAVVANGVSSNAAEVNESQRQARIAVEESIADLEIAGANTADVASSDSEDEDPGDEGDGDEVDAMDRDQLKARLDDAGVAYAGNASNESLRAQVRGLSA